MWLFLDTLFLSLMYLSTSRLHHTVLIPAAEQTVSRLCSGSPSSCSRLPVCPVSSFLSQIWKEGLVSVCSERYSLLGWSGDSQAPNMQNQPMPLKGEN